MARNVCESIDLQFILNLIVQRNFIELIEVWVGNVWSEGKWYLWSGKDVGLTA